MTNVLPAKAVLLWSAILGVAVIVGSYGFACVFPFVAVATIAALTLDARSGAALVAAAWVANQLVGFGLMNYPHTLDTLGWGVAIGVAAFAAFAAARAISGSNSALLSARSGFAFAGAFVAYEGVLFGWAQVAGGLETFSSTIVAGIAANDAAWFVGLALLRLLIVRVAPDRFANALPA